MADAPAQDPQRQLADIDAVDKNLALDRVQQPGDEAREGGLAAADGSDQRERFGDADMQADTVQGGGPRIPGSGR